MRNKEDFAPFDAADYLESPEDASAFLDVALVDSLEDPTDVPQALDIIARSRITRLHIE